MKNILRKYFQNSLIYDASIKRYFILLSLLFTFSLLIGIEFTWTNPDVANIFFNSIVENVQKMGFDDPFNNMVSIFTHNSKIAAITILLGIFFGIVPIFIACVNGIAIGLVGTFIASEVGIGTIFLGFIPHGIVELPAILYSASIGIWIGMAFLRKLRKQGSFIDKLKKVISEYFFVIIPMLILAAFVESYITAYILSFVT